MAQLRLDTQAIGLDTALALSRWLTGTEHLHYGLWTGLDVAAGNVGRAQDAYSAQLFSYLPSRPNLRILDIGGGAGETAKKLIALGHSVEIVVPSAYLAGRCRVNAPQAVVHECYFQDLNSAGGFDLCLFSESFQYIPLNVSLSKAISLLNPQGEILIGDCFRSSEYTPIAGQHICGGGHPIARFRTALADQPLTILAERDITAAAAPSIDVEQALFNVLGRGLSSLDAELKTKRRVKHWILHRLLSVLATAPKRDRMAARLFEQARNSTVFMANNTYLFLRLGQTGQPK